MTNDRATTTTATTHPTSTPYPGARYGVLVVKFVPDPGLFTQRGLLPRVRAFCGKCLTPHLRTYKQLLRSSHRACPSCHN